MLFTSFGKCPVLWEPTFHLVLPVPEGTGFLITFLAKRTRTGWNKMNGISWKINGLIRQKKQSSILLLLESQTWLSLQDMTLAYRCDFFLQLWMTLIKMLWDMAREHKGQWKNTYHFWILTSLMGSVMVVLWILRVSWTSPVF